MLDVYYEFACKALELSGILYLSRRRTSDRPRILMYHGVGSGRNPDEVKAEAFRAQMTYVQMAFQVVPLTTLIGYLEASADRKTNDSRPLVAVTFDDGLIGMYAEALPILEELKVPATVFVVTDLLSTGEPVWTEEVTSLVGRLPEGRYRLGEDRWLTLPRVAGELRDREIASLKAWLKTIPPDRRGQVLEQLRCFVPNRSGVEGERTITWDLARQMTTSGLVTLESHSSSHEILTLLDDDALEREVAGSREALARGLGVESSVFCYPNGDHDERVVRAVERAGFRAALTTRPGLCEFGMSCYRLPRVGVSRKTGHQVFKAKLAGVNPPIPRAPSRRRLLPK